MPFTLKLIIAVLTIELLGGAGGFVTAKSIGTWYANLEKPVGTPPNWVFGPVWTTLYAMIGVSFALIWQQGFREKPARVGLILFIVQLTLNLIWTPIFFGFHQMGAALAVILMLGLTILATMIQFAKCSRLAAWLLLPYLLWVSYATYLNASFLILNS